VKTNLIVGDVTLADYTAVGSNSVIMPGNQIPMGTVIGALSFVPPNFHFEAWSVYAGNPIRLLRSRNRDNVLEQAAKLDKFFRQASTA
jgi:acetyltransferase-like isoleucine patch superfamily enzyme